MIFGGWGGVKNRLFPFENCHEAQMEAKMGEAMRKAFELKEPPEEYGSKIVPSPYATQKR